MSRPSRSERLAAKGRPKRRAAKTHFFKYQLANNPSRAEENDLKRALQESLEEQKDGSKRSSSGSSSNNNNIVSSTNSSDVSRSNNSSSLSNESAGSIVCATSKRTRSSTPFVNTPPTLNNKRAKLNVSNGHQDNNKCDGNPSVSFESPTTTTPLPPINRAIKTYSRSRLNIDTRYQQKQLFIDAHLKSTNPINNKPTLENLSFNDKETRLETSSKFSVSRSTQTPGVSSSKLSLATSTPSKVNSVVESSPTIAVENHSLHNPEVKLTPVQDHYLKLKRESKNYAYVKMTALKVSTSKSPSSNSKSSSSKKHSPNGILHNNSTNKDSLNVSPKTNNNGNKNSTFGHGSSSVKQTDNSTNGVRYENKSNTKHDTNSGKKSPANISPTIVPQNGMAPDNSNKKSKASKNVQGSQIGKSSIPKHDIIIHAGAQDRNNDCSLDDTIDLSTKNQNQANVKLTKKRLTQGSWSLLGVPEERDIYLPGDEPPKHLICYPAIRHVEGDVIQVRDSVLLRSAKKTDLAYIAKVCAFWEDAETGGVMMSLYWYYRPEHTEEGRKPHHLSDEIFASRHRDVDSVECIEDKCYVLTFNEYCRYRKRCKMEQVDTTWSLTDVTIPVSNESYPRRNKIPSSDINPELVFCCRQIYDSRMKRLVKNPLINPKYGHI